MIGKRLKKRKNVHIAHFKEKYTFATVNFLAEILLGKSNDFYKKMYALEQTVFESHVKKAGSFSENLPIVNNDLNHYINGNVFERGDILERPMYNNLHKFYLKHYGIYYGTDDFGKAYIINKEADGFIYVRTLFDYMKELKLEDTRILKKPEETTIDEIIRRAKEIEKEPYTALSNNCQHFVNYSVYGKYTSLTSDVIKQEFTDKWHKVKYFKKSQK